MRKKTAPDTPLARIMADRGIDVLTLAAASGVCMRTIYRMMYGQRLFADTAGKIATVLDVTIEELLGASPE